MVAAPSTNLCSDFKVAPAVTAPRASQGTSSLAGEPLTFHVYLKVSGFSENQ